MTIDDGHAVHYTELRRGTPVYGSDELQVGTVVQVLDNYRERILDGIVIDRGGGDLRFVDAPEVARTAERAVTLSIPASEVEQLSAPEGQPRLVGARLRSKLGRLRRGR